ncbi:MAG: pyridoxamine 5'-phosphate oxidase family protein [Acidimicrobiia bacterium]|nr:pyridoxamine 5'-phosphate oxidase family protein [Acidimicrobiia bacterium]
MVELDPRGLEILSREECLRLLEPGGVGRLAWVVRNHPVIRPVNFALDDHRLVIRTGAGSIYIAATSSLPATFEIDKTRNVDHTAWSVVVNGTIRVADDNVARQLPLRSWAPVRSDHFVEISIADVSGRRIGPDR